jgi:hypothetical protein
MILKINKEKMHRMKSKNKKLTLTKSSILKNCWTLFYKILIKSKNHIEN